MRDKQLFGGHSLLRGLANNQNTLNARLLNKIKLNNAKVYYTTQDQRGNYRVGNNFVVDLENGRTSFDIESIFARL